MKRDLAGALFAALLIAIAFAASDSTARAAGDAAPLALSCGGGAEMPEVEALRAEVAGDGHALASRLKLAEALIAHHCYAEAVRVLEAGEALHPNSRSLQTQLRTARTMLSEQHYFDELDRAAQSAKIERNRLRCQKLGDIAACDEALQAAPNDAGLVIAKADALAQTNRPVEAIPLYRHAAELDPQAAGIGAKLAAAESQRQTLLSQCQSESAEPALRACQLALLPGAGDEFSIYKRKGILLQQMDEPLRALDSFIAAGLLRGDDEMVARAIVSLTDSTGRNDAVAFAARGRALLALNRGAEAVEALVQARSLLPDMSGTEAPLAAAEELAKSEARHKKPPVTQPPAQPSTPAPVVAATASAVEAAPQEVKRTYSNDSLATRSH
jgi:tetratricopeptide (TPR) repeat protein